MRNSLAGWRGFKLIPIGGLGLALACGFVAAAEPSATVPLTLSAVTAQAHELMAASSAKVPGLAVAVAVDGKIVWSEAFGYADLATKKLAATTTRFRIGNISESLTAAGLVLLVQRGELDLDAPVQKYVPDFPVKPEGVITTRLAAGHLAGIRYYRGSETHLDRPFASIHDGLGIFENDPLLSAPGTRFNYSTYGWSLVSAVMESAAHRDFLDFMKSEVFQPLGMDHTGPDRAGAVDPDRTRFYRKREDGKFVEAEPINSSYKWAGGGFLSTAEDLVRFGSGLLQPGLLNDASLKLLFTSQKTADGKPTGNGIGWFVRQDEDGRPFYYHTGGQQGATSMIFIAPNDHLVVALVCNLTAADILGEGKQIADLFDRLPQR